jgi:hypothetical protein
MPPHRRLCLGRCDLASAAPGRGQSCRSAGNRTSGRWSRQQGPRQAGRIQQQEGRGRQWLRQAGGCPCANPAAAGSPQAQPTRRPAAVALQPHPPGRRSHRRRPDTSGRRSRRPAERIGSAAAHHCQVDVLTIAEHLGHGAAVLVDGLGAECHHRTDRATAGGRRPIFTLREKLRALLAGLEGFRAFWAAPALMAVSPDP